MGPGRRTLPHTRMDGFATYRAEVTREIDGKYQGGTRKFLFPARNDREAEEYARHRWHKADKQGLHAPRIRVKKVANYWREYD